MVIAIAGLVVAAIASPGPRQRLYRPTVTHELVVTSTLEQKDHAHLLRFKIRNVSRRTVTVYSSDLPWSPQQPAGLIIAAARVDPPSQPLQPHIEIRSSDLGPPIKVKPGAILTGAVNLNELFPDLSAALEHEDVCIFWHDTIELAAPSRFNESFNASCIPWNHYGELVGDPVPSPPN